MRTSDGPTHDHRGNTPGEILERIVPAYTEANEHLARIAAELVSSRGVARTGADSRPIINGASGRLTYSPGTLAGWSIRETSGAGKAVVRLHDGLDETGDVIAAIGLTASASNTQWLMPNGVGVVTGVYVEVVSGAVEGAVWVSPVHRA